MCVIGEAILSSSIGTDKNKYEEMNGTSMVR